MGLNRGARRCRNERATGEFVFRRQSERIESNLSWERIASWHLEMAELAVVAMFYYAFYYPAEGKELFYLPILPFENIYLNSTFDIDVFYFLKHVIH